jgi:hypothetical protein
MASEIRANTIKNRVGLSTINITDTGIVVSGISTFSGVSNFNSNISVSGNLNVAQNIVHTGDTDTKIEFLNNNICFDTAGGERVRITSGGNVGVGTVSPTDPLHVYHASDNFVGRFESGDAGGGIVLKDPTHSTTLITNDGDFTLNVDNGGDVTGESIRFEMSGSEKVRIDSNGRLLVSRSGLTASKNVGTKTGEIQVAAGGNSAAISLINYSNDASSPYLMLGKSRAGNTTGNTIVQADDRLGEIAFCGADGNDIDSFGAAIKAWVDGTPGNNDMPGRLVFYTTGDGSQTAQERLRITSLGNFEFGTAVDPGNNLRYFDVANYNTGANAGVVERLLTRKSDGTGVAGLDIVKYKAGGAFLINYETIGSNGYITFSTGENGGSPTPRVTINGTGNLKIDTAGKGIDFSANSNLAGMTEEVLDHYEVGTYVPTWSGATNPTTYRNGIDSGTNSNGLSYVRIGNQVTVTGSAFWTGASINNARPYMSLPFQARTYSVSGTIANYSLGVTSEIHYLNYDSTTSINMFIQTNSGLHGSFGDNSTGEMYFNITYMTY